MTMCPLSEGEADPSSGDEGDPANGGLVARLGGVLMGPLNTSQGEEKCIVFTSSSQRCPGSAASVKEC
jgi:hypothetical protein